VRRSKTQTAKAPPLPAQAATGGATLPADRVEKRLDGPKHFHTTGHPAMKSAEANANGGWCYIDEIQFDSL
jgi:hypothetical protein